MAEGYVDAQSVNRGHEADTHHVVGLPIYFAVFAALMIGTVLTVLVSLFDLDERLFAGANTLVALLIAFVKMSLVVLYFMHVRYSGKLIWMCVIAGFLFLGIMFAFTMSDYLTRGTIPPVNSIQGR